MEALAGEASGRSSPSWFNPPHCGLLILLEVYISDHLSHQWSTNYQNASQSTKNMLCFPERNEISFPSYRWKSVSLDYICSCTYSACILCVSLCHVKRLGWPRCRPHTFCSHLACHLSGESKPICVHILPFWLQWHLLWGDAYYSN